MQLHVTVYLIKFSSLELTVLNRFYEVRLSCANNNIDNRDMGVSGYALVFLVAFLRTTDPVSRFESAAFVTV